MRKLGDFELNKIYTGDAKELAIGIPDESVDLIYTDPVYQDTDSYAWLAQEASRVLKDNRPCLAWCSKVGQYECKPAMEEYLTYQTTLFYTVMAKSVRPAFQIGIMSWTTPCLVFTKGIYKCEPFLVDTWISSNSPQSKFAWQKNTSVSVRWIDAFTKHGGVVVDFFCGSGSFLEACNILGLRWLAFEIDPSVAAEARERVALQPVLFPNRATAQVEMSFGAQAR